MFKVSVIIPIYNSEKYLNNLIENIERQTFKDFQVIFVNDGSQDNSQQILQEYCNNAPNATLISQENKGVSSARNKGLEIAKGEYIVFWDADDQIAPNFLLDMVANFQNKVLTICGYTDVGLKQGELIKLASQEEQVTVLHKNEVLFLQNVWLFNTLWNKIFDKKVIDKLGLKFNEQSTFGEDAEFVANYVKEVDKYQVLNKSLYTYIRRNTNASSKYHKNVYANHKSMYEAILEAMDDKAENYDRCQKEIKSAYFIASISSLWHYCKHSKQKTNDKIKFILKDISTNKNLLPVKINPFLKLVLKLKWVWLTKFYYKIVLRGNK